MEKIKRIAMIAHDNRKKDLIEWVEWNLAIADFMISSTLFEKPYQQKLKYYHEYIDRSV